MRRLFMLALLLALTPMLRASQTWYIRAGGGTRYSAYVTTGQCDGLADVDYPGSGSNQHCAFNDVRYLWADNSGQPNAWVMAGGDTAVIRDCHALAAQTNPSNPNCRLGYDNATNGNPPNYWCGYGNPNTLCYNPPIPAGTSGNPTKILGGCAYGTYTCTPINNSYPYTGHNETQLFGGFGLTWTFNLESTSYVTIEGIELTTHNGVCTSAGSPAYPRGCNTSPPYDDFAANGFLFNNASSNITLQDVYIHGFNSSGLYGPIGGQINMTRVFSGFNAFAGWNFDDGSGTPDATGSGINAQYVTMNFNGCYEQYPITATYPAQVCYDTNSQGFGDSWSGQGVGTESVMSGGFTCNFCVSMYNTKDGFIGPHIAIPNLVITNSVEIGNMGSNWKWGGEDAYPMTLTFNNNLTVNNCYRMDSSMTALGVPSTFNMYLSGFCRAGGNGMASEMPTGSTWNISNSTFISADSVALYVACANPAVTTCPATINSTNNIYIGYIDPSTGTGQSPTLYYFCDYYSDTCSNGNGAQAPNIAVVSTYNDEYGMRNGDCPTSSGGMICTSPLMLNQPSSVVPESNLDVFNNPLSLSSSSRLASASSPPYEAGTNTGCSTDFFDGTAQTNPCTMGILGIGSNGATGLTITGGAGSGFSMR